MAELVRSAPYRPDRPQTGFIENVKHVEVRIDRLGAFDMHDGGHDVRLETGANFRRGAAHLEPAARLPFDSEENRGHGQSFGQSVDGRNRPRQRYIIGFPTHQFLDPRDLLVRGDENGEETARKTAGERTWVVDLTVLLSCQELLLYSITLLIEEPKEHVVVAVENYKIGCHRCSLAERVEFDAKTFHRSNSESSLNNRTHIESNVALGKRKWLLLLYFIASAAAREPILSVIYVIGTCDTKEPELIYARREIERTGAKAKLVDVSTGSTRPSGSDISAAEVARFHPEGEKAVLGLEDRGAAVAAMSEALARFLSEQSDVGGVLGLGGSGNTSIVTAGMRALPIGIPKVMVSTLASGNVSSYVGQSDIAMMYAVTDVAGLNAISRRVIGNAAHAVAGMVVNAIADEAAEKPTVGLTMFGVTTPCVTHIRALIGPAYECFVFHATGIGGQTMEKLVESKLLDTIIDITTTEVADFLFEGQLACTEDRFGAAIRTGIPYVGSTGALDMINFGPRASVPKKFDKRHFHIHNPQVTLMRTTAEENQSIGEWIVERLNSMRGPARFLLPLRGVSALDKEGQPFHDPVADNSLFSAIRRGWAAAPNRKLIEVDAHINDTAFATEVVEQFRLIA